MQVKRYLSSFDTQSCDEAFWALVGNYRKGQVDVDEAEESAKKAAVRACETA